MRPLRLLGLVTLLIGLAMFFGGVRLLGSGDPATVALGGLLFLFSIPMVSIPLAYM